MSRGPEADLAGAGRALTDWYRGRGRDLPWRRKVTPYRVLVSEIMLQQTRAGTVVPRFEAFIERFPDPAALAAAPEDDVLKLWEGLGYYSRARNLRRAAQVMVREHSGEVPAAAEALRSLPGVGDYTAAAVQAIAFRKTVVAVDANAVRIASRLTAASADGGSAAGREAARSVLEAMISPEAPDDFTQALMELGQTVCRPRRAECQECPLAGWCAGRADPLQYPGRRQAPAKPETHLTVAALFTADRTALRRRPPKGLLAGLYEPLNWTGEPDEAEVRSRLENLGLEVVEIRALEPWRHEFTHRIWQLQGWRIAVKEATKLGDVIWADREALARQYAVPTAFRPAVSEWESTPWKDLWSKDLFFGNT